MIQTSSSFHEIDQLRVFRKVSGAAREVWSHIYFREEAERILAAGKSDIQSNVEGVEPLEPVLTRSGLFHWN